MKPAPFEYVAPRSVEEALEALERRRRAGAGGRAEPVAAAQRAPRAANPAGRHQRRRPRGDPPHRRSGCGSAPPFARPRSSARRLVREPLAAAGRRPPAHVGHVATRTRGTLGGSVAHADPRAQLPAGAARRWAPKGHAQKGEKGKVRCAAKNDKGIVISIPRCRRGRAPRSPNTPARAATSPSAAAAVARGPRARCSSRCWGSDASWRAPSTRCARAPRRPRGRGAGRRDGRPPRPPARADRGGDAPRARKSAAR